MTHRARYQTELYLKQIFSETKSLAQICIFSRVRFHKRLYLKNKPRNRSVIGPTFNSNQFIVVIPFSIMSFNKTICDEVILGNISLPTNSSNQTLLGMLQ